MIQRHVNGNMIDLDFTIDGDTLPELQWHNVDRS